MKIKDRYQWVLGYFTTHFPNAETELNYSNPFELLVAVILSAQCTDKRVNLITPPLFKAFPDAQSMSSADFDMLFPFIRSISYPNNKTKHLIGMSQMLLTQFGGEVPGTLEELQKLPGVGRKTANVILSVIYNQPTMAVDTHVYRVSRRIGLAAAADRTPLAVEKKLMRYIPKELVPLAHHWLILHGRYVCLARRPQCANCGLQQGCKFFQVNNNSLAKV
jgi:endonuclease III